MPHSFIKIILLFIIPLSCSVAHTLAQQVHTKRPHYVLLTWHPSKTRTVVKYNVYRSAGHGYHVIGSTHSLVYVDLKVVAGVAYRYVVTAVDNHGHESKYSEEADAVIPRP